MNLGVFMDDLSSGRNHMRQIEKAVGGLLDCSGDDPDGILSCRHAGFLQSLDNHGLIEFDQIWKIVTREIGLRKKNHLASGFRGNLDVMEGSLKVKLECSRPMR